MSWRDLLCHELRAMFGNRSFVLTVFGGVLFYCLLYPLPYSQQIPREQKVVVVNLDGSQLSRRLERMVDATPQVELAARADSIEEAQQLFIDRHLAGILTIPENFHRDLLLGRRPSLAFAGDASYILVYSTVLEGMLGAGNTMAAEVKVTRMVMSGQALALAAEQYSAILLNLRPVFNETLGYVNYIIPAVFVLILHQTLLIGAGLIGGCQNQAAGRSPTGYWLQVSPLRLLVIRSLLLTLIYWLLCIGYFGAAFAYYEVPRLADPGELQLLMLPFLLAAAMLGIAIGALLPRPELATLVVLLSSMPLVFGAGFVWPKEAIPFWLSRLLDLVPVVPGIGAFLRLNQMGADVADVLPLWQHMWWLVAGYGLLAWLLLARRQRLAQGSGITSDHQHQATTELAETS